MKKRHWPAAPGWITGAHETALVALAWLFLGPIVIAVMIVGILRVWQPDLERVFFGGKRR